MAAGDIANLFIPKAIVSVKFEGDAEFTDLGEIPEAEYTPSLETLDYFSNRTGVRTKKRTVVIEKGGTLRLLMNEAAEANMSLAMLGDLDTDSDGRPTVDIFSQNSRRGEVKIVGTNEVGPKWEHHFYAVDFIPSSSVNFITDEWGALEVTGNLAANDAGKFGLSTLIANEGDEDSESA